VTGEGPSPPHQIWVRFRIPLIPIVLTASAAVVFLLRLHTLLGYPYPPSNDAGGDLYSAQQWLGHPISGIDVSLQPPLYYWLVVIPSVWAFGPFVGPQFYMALVPALLVFPGYLVCRETQAGVAASVLGGVALAIAAPFSLMVAWNGSYNAFAIVFLTFFVALLIRALRTRARRDCILAGVTFALVAATHELTFVVAALVLAFTCAVVLIIARERREVLGPLSWVVGVGVLACLPLVPFYLLSAGGSANLGVGEFQGQLNFAYTTFPYFAWGFQSATLTGLALLDIVVATLGLVGLWVWTPTRISGVVLTSVWFGGLMIPLLSASNAVRGLYFLAIPAVLVMPAFFERLVVRGIASPNASPTATEPPSNTSTPPEEDRVRRQRAWRRRRAAAPYPGIAVVAIAAFCVLNANFSIQTLNSATQYYLTLSTENVAALNWLASNTSSNATIYDSLGIEPWIWGYAHRLAYAPAPLGVESTASSLKRTQQADAIWLGSSLLENDQITVAENAPSPVGLPTVYVNVPGYWMQMISTQADLVNFTLEYVHTSYVEPLATATLASNTSSVSGTGSVLATYLFEWESLGFGVTEGLNLTGESLSVTWTGVNATLESTTGWLGLVPPNPTYGSAVSQPDVVSAPQIADTYLLNGVPFSMTLSGGTFNQSVESNGWAYVWCVGTRGWTVEFGGLAPVGNQPPAYVDTSTLVRQLGIDYFTANSVTSYPLFLRLAHRAIGSARILQVFNTGDTYIFSVGWA
jgi:hypothetical protein